LQSLHEIVLQWLHRREPYLRSLEVKEVFIGLKYCAAKVRGPRGDALGLAYVDYLDCFTFDPPSSIPGNAYSAIIRLIKSSNMLERVVSIALLNAVSQYLLWNSEEYRSFKLVESNLINFIAELCRNARNAIVVGNMGPIVRALKDRGINVVVLERSPLMRLGALPDVALLTLDSIPEVAIITGATLVNGTIDTVLQRLRSCKIKILVGPTAGIHPEIAQSLGIDVLASLRVRDLDATMECIKLGGGRWHFAKYCNDYVIDLRVNRADHCTHCQP